ncbi:hypothetical protein D0Y65_047875 [Glycine soja]|uniref:Uncharacterized protein n=1 Tax=Glycine soja TaxID=3848 RepID=A0A445FQR8_GLYSO|nr:hypothetical protein D0Y65_047875 [Glycine soja]
MLKMPFLYFKKNYAPALPLPSSFPSLLRAPSSAFFSLLTHELLLVLLPHEAAVGALSQAVSSSSECLFFFREPFLLPLSVSSSFASSILLFFIEVRFLLPLLPIASIVDCLRMSRSCASSSRWTSVNEELEHIVAHMPMRSIRHSVVFCTIVYIKPIRKDCKRMDAHPHSLMLRPQHLWKQLKKILKMITVGWIGAIILGLQLETGDEVSLEKTIIQWLAASQRATKITMWTKVSGQKKKEIQAAGVSLSEPYALSEVHSSLSVLENPRRGSVREMCAQRATSSPSESFVPYRAQHAQLVRSDFTNSRLASQTR